MSNNKSKSHNGSYIQNLIPNVDTEENQYPYNQYQGEQESPSNKQSPFQSRNNFTKGSNRNPNKSTKSTFQLQLSQLQSKLFHQVILKSQLSSQTQFDRQVVRKLSQSVKDNLQETLTQIQQTYQKLSNPLLNNYQKLQIKQKILQLRMLQLANTKVLVSTYRHHQYRIVVALAHISMIYQQLKCHEQAIVHLENAIALNDSYRHVSKDVQYFHSILLTFLGASQHEAQDFKLSLQNLNKALQIYDSLKTDQYECHDFFSLNLISHVLNSANKNSQAISFAKMALNSAKNDYTIDSIEYAEACKTLAEAQSSFQQYQSAIQHIKLGIQVLQHNLPEREQTIISFYQKLTELTLKKLNSQKPSSIQIQDNYFDPYIAVLRKKYEVIENTFGYRDKRVIKQKRHLASSLLKYAKIKDAQDQLQDILEIQQVVYGQKSVEVAKTLKLLGTVAMSQNQSSKAQKFLKKSMGIFHDQGQVNLEKQVQAKLLILTGKGKFLINTKA